MPWRDGTGPFGYGPMTGRWIGPCGRGVWRHPFYGPKLTKEEERAVLEDGVKELETEIKSAKERLAELQS
jgi:hypothetical protein